MEQVVTTFTGMEATTVARPPRPWLAALLSLLQPGLGHLYAWQPGLAMRVWVASIVVGLAGALTFMRAGSLAVAVLGVALAAVALIAPAVHAWRTAAGSTVTRPSRGTLAGVLVAAWLALMLVGAAEKKLLRERAGETFRIPSVSMLPTIMPGDWIVTVPLDGRAAVRGDLVVYRNADGVDLVKRAVGTGGDTLAMRGGRLVRNGRAVAEPYVNRDGESVEDSAMFAWQRPALVPGAVAGDYRPTTDDWGPLVVPTGTLFVLGDTRHNSLDSRHVGGVPLDRVSRRPTYVYFSRDPETGTVRWTRIGRRLDR